MKFLNNIIYVLSGYIKLSLLKVFHINSVIFKNIPRISFLSSIVLSKKAEIKIGRNIKIEKFSVISVLKNAKLKIGDNVYFGFNNRIVCHDDIKIDSGTIIGPNVCIYDHDHKYDKENGVNSKEYDKSPILIGKNCWIGANTVILKGTVLGDNCLVAAGSVIKGKFPKGSKIIQKRETIIR